MENAEESTRKPEQEPLEGLNPSKVLERVLHSVSSDKPDLPWTPLEPKEVEDLLSGYEVDSLMGRGGMGAVYKVFHKELHRVCALKLLPISVSERPDFEERFLREARAMANLQHPNIVHLYDFGRTVDGHLYYVMEYVEGADLACLIKDGGVSFREALNIVSQVCDALEYAHAQGYIHRDVKPSNVLLNAEGKVKVVDFGLAKIIHDQGADPSMTLLGEVVGTPGYMSPEQTTGGTVDHRTDIYALGVMLYEMLTGSLPQGNFELPSEKSGVNKKFDTVVLQALHQEPNRRYQQVSEVKEALTECGKLKELKKPSQPANNRVMVIAAVLLVALLGAGLLIKETASLENAEGVKPLPTLASKYTNSLGMHLVPVRGTQVLFSQWETRWSDWDAFLQETQYQWVAPEGNYPDDHPAMNISWEDAQAFCKWLTERERRNGRLGEGMEYRLPTDLEWSAAVGLSPEDGSSPRMRSSKVEGVYPWEATWPVPESVKREVDKLDSTAFGVVSALRQARGLVGAPMDARKIKEFKQMTYWMEAQSWNQEMAAVAPDFVDLPEHMGRVMVMATDQVQVRHWNGKTVVLLARWMAYHARTVFDYIEWETGDWADERFCTFFANADWGHESGLSLYSPAKWDDKGGRWLHHGKPLAEDLFASEYDRQRYPALRAELRNGVLSLHHDNRTKICHPVIVFDGILTAEDLRQKTEEAYNKLQEMWFQQAARVCQEVLPSLEWEWESRSLPVQQLVHNKFDLHGLSGSAKEWVLDDFDAQADGIKTLRGGAIRLRGRGGNQLDPAMSQREVIDSVIAYSVPAETELLSSYRESAQRNVRKPWYGFRVVLDVQTRN